jgi:hypothetical protein
VSYSLFFCSFTVNCEGSYECRQATSYTSWFKSTVVMYFIPQVEGYYLACGLRSRKFSLLVILFGGRVFVLTIKLLSICRRLLQLPFECQLHIPYAFLRMWFLIQLILVGFILTLDSLECVMLVLLKWLLVSFPLCCCLLI